MPAGRILEGSAAIAHAVRLCRPHVVAAYPITPQTHIVENIAQMVADGQISCEFTNVESEFAAASVVLGASAAGTRAYTASSSQGILLMTEVLYNISGMRLPVVMTCVNRAISAPLNIWNDQQDSISVRDSGWMQLYAEDPQEAFDLHVCAFKIAEDHRVLLPAMVCMDGFLLTHCYEPVEIPEQEAVDRFLPPRDPLHALDPQRPASLGAYADPSYYMEHRYMVSRAMQTAHDVIEQVTGEFSAAFGRKLQPFIEQYRMEGAREVIVTMGSIASTVKDAVDERRARGEAVGLVRLVTYRPFPAQELTQALAGVERVAVLEKAISVGAAGPLAAEVRSALYGRAAPVVSGFVIGLGGRDVTAGSIHRVFDRLQGPPGDNLFVDLKPDLVGDLAPGLQREWQTA